MNVANVDPLALYGAALSTFILLIQVYRELRDRPRLAAVVSTHWPEFQPNKYSDLGGDPSPMYVRLELTNTGRRPVTLRSAGLTLRLMDARPHGLREQVRFHLPSGRMNRLQLPLSLRGTSEHKTLEEGQAWVLQRTAEDVAWDVADQPVGHVAINGAFAETSTGKRHYWNAKVVQDDVLELGQPPWQPPDFDPDDPAADDHNPERTRAQPQ